MATVKTISYLIDEHTAILTIDNPPANTLNMALLDGLAKHIDHITKNPTIKVVVLTSSWEKFFVAGADIKELAAIDSAQAGKKYSAKGQIVFEKIEHSHKPFIAAVEGYCLGGGCELALACHLRIAGVNAQFGFPEINLGILPGFGGTHRLPHLIGSARALELMLTGNTLTANDAFAIGMVNRVVKHNAALDTALTLAKQIQSKSALAISAILNSSRTASHERLRKESQAFGNLLQTEDAKEGINAFLEKRVPHFKDR